MSTNENKSEGLTLSDLPKSISAYLDQYFNNDLVSGLQKKDKNGESFYILDVDHNGVLHHLKFDEEGNYISERNEITAETDEEHFTTLGGGD